MRAVIRIGAVISAVAILGAISFAQQPGRNSFLTVSAKTTDELIAQVRSNPNIRDSYERHFQMNESQLVTYLRTLRPVRLNREGVYTVYSVPPGGELKAHTQRLRKGELVFMDPNGQPILRARCGNPLVGAPPGVVPEEELSAVPVPEMREMAVPTAEVVPNVALALQPAPPVIPEEVIATPATQPISTVTSAHAQGIPLLPLLALPALVATTHNGGGGNPVPEPATMVALAIGAGTLIARKRRGR
ncbi:MAG: hypothetical protein QOJ65_424 [Fimbriimonadaceae bacterium]|jgi:hypothetical protein|nr:hypothetical protein [Fimbriimonadaceae bacterium]